MLHFQNLEGSTEQTPFLRVLGFVLWETVQYLCVLCVELVSGSSKVSDSSKVSESKVSEKNECCVCVFVFVKEKGGESDV